MKSKKIVKIEKENARKYQLFKRPLNTLIFTLIWFFVFMIGRQIWNWLEFYYDSLPFFNFTYLGYIFLFMVCFEIFRYVICIMRINTLNYEIDFKEKIINESYKVIAKTKNEHRLQIFNSFDIEQSIVESFFGLFNVNLSSRNNDDEDTITIQYLSEAEAERIIGLLKIYNQSERKEKFLKVDLVNRR